MVCVHELISDKVHRYLMKQYINTYYVLFITIFITERLNQFYVKYNTWQNVNAQQKILALYIRLNYEQNMQISVCHKHTINVHPFLKNRLIICQVTTIYQVLHCDRQITKIIYHHSLRNQADRLLMLNIALRELDLHQYLINNIRNHDKYQSPTE